MLEILRIPIASQTDVDDAPEILAVIKKLSVYYERSPYVREFVRSILPPWTGHNDRRTIIATITGFVRDKVIYLPDPAGVEYIQAPTVLLELIRTGRRPYGDCDDKALLFASMLGAVGQETRIVGVHLKPDSVFWDHVIVGVKYNGQWLDIDPCVVNNEQPQYGEKLVSDL